MREYIIFAKSDHYNVLGIARALGEKGLKSVAVIVESHPHLLKYCKYVKKVYYITSIDEGIPIIKKLHHPGDEKYFILAGDDVAVECLDRHYKSLKDDFIFYNSEGHIKEFMNKDFLNHLAESYGFNIPKTWIVSLGEIPEDIKFPVITKAIDSCGKEWKNIVKVCYNEEDLKEAYLHITESSHILLQQYIEKADEYGYEGISINHGQDVLLTMRSSQVYNMPGHYSPYWYMKNLTESDPVSSMISMIQDLGFEGIFEYEFLVDTGGNLYFLEINFRNTVLGWATHIAGMPAVTLWINATEYGYIPKGFLKQIPEGFTTMAECYDYDLRVKSGIISKKEWKSQYKKVNAKLYRGRKDILPFISFMLYKLFHHKRVVKR